MRRAESLPDPIRQRELTQLAVLPGLRGASERLKMELKTIGPRIKDNAFLRDAWVAAMSKGIMAGKPEGKVEGMGLTLFGQFEAKFGPLPKWGGDRLRKATVEQAQRWAQTILTADSLEAALGER